MRALVMYEHGGLDKLIYETGYRNPTLVPGHVIVRIGACSLNYHDIFTRRGMPGIDLNLPLITGLDMAGEIAAVADDVVGWRIGDRVLVDPINRLKRGLMGETVDGGLAELCLVAAHQLIALDDAVDFAAASTLPCAYGTAHRMMVTRGQIKAGEKVLVLGASGGVGTCAVQLAKLAGAEVIAAASTPQKLDRLATLGADHGINYVEQDFMRAVWEIYGKPRVIGGGGVDVVINFTGGETWVPSLRALTKGGRMLTCGATAGFDPKTDIRFIWTFEHNVMGSNGWTVEDIEALLAMVKDGRLDPLIDKVLPLEDGREAHRLLEEREVFGKIVVAP